MATHALERAAERDTATVAWGRSAKAEWRFHRGTWDTQHPAITLPVLAKHRSATPEAPAYPVKNTDAPKYRTGRQSSGPHSSRRQRTCSSMCTAI